MTELFDLIKASLFTNDPVHLSDWQSVFTEMKDQSIAALPGEWLKTYPIAPEWRRYCLVQQSQWVRVMYAQEEVIRLLEENKIPSVVIKGAAAAMYYPHPMLRSMGDVDILVKRADQERTAALLEANGFTLTKEKRKDLHHYSYRKNDISIELHKRLGVVDNEDEELLKLFEDGIDNRIWQVIEGDFKVPVLPLLLNGLVLIFHINQHLREGIGLRQIIDWMMYADQLSAAQWSEFSVLLKHVGMEKLALTTTRMCREYLGLKAWFPGCDEIDPGLCDEFMAFIMEKGSFGKKAGLDGKIEAFTLLSNDYGSFFRQLQAGGLCQWKAARKYAFLRPFAWIYQGFRILGVLIKNGVSIGKTQEQKKRGRKQRKLIEALGLHVDRRIKTE